MLGRLSSHSLATLWLAGLACVQEPQYSVPPGRSCDPLTDLALGVSQELTFDVEKMPCLDVTLPDPEYKQLSRSSRFGNADPVEEVIIRLTTDCSSPFPGDYPWFEADLTTGGRHVERVGVRKKGFLGSVVDEGFIKPSLKIKTDRYVAGQRLGQSERITLNNSIHDGTRMKDCLAYALFAAADYPAPRCNLANVMVNGEPTGSYIHVEPLKKKFLSRAFGDDTGSFYEGTVVDFTPDFFSEFDSGNLGRWEAKTSSTDPTGRPLLAVLEALETPDSALLPALDRAINLESFYRFWALEVLLDHADGYSANRNNYFVYFDPTDNSRGVFVPWGVDSILRDGNSNDRSAFPRDLRTYVFAELPRRLSTIPEAALAFQNELRRMMDEVWQESALLDTVSDFAAHVRSAQDDPKHEAEVERLRRWIANRRQRINGFLNRGFPLGTREPHSCFELGLDGGLDRVHEGSDDFNLFTLTW